MTDRCYKTEEFGELAALPPDDPRRAHLADCPRCRADLSAYLAFLHPRELPTIADPEDARMRLAAALEREILSGHPSPGGSVRASGEQAGHRLRALWRTLTRPALRPAWGLAVVALLVVATQQIAQFSRHPSEPIVLRGPDGTVAAVVTATMEQLDDGSARFTWAPAPGAESYRIAFFRGDLSELETIDAGARNALLVDAPTVARLAAGEPVLYWQLVCLRGGEECGRSALGSLEWRR